MPETDKTLPIQPRFAPGGLIDSQGGRRIAGMGWQPDVPDFRDYTIDSLLEKFKKKKSLLLYSGIHGVKDGANTVMDTCHTIISNMARPVISGQFLRKNG